MTTNFSKISFTGLMCASISLFFLFGTNSFAQLYTPDRVPKLIDDLPVFFKSLEIQLLSDTSDGLLNSFTLLDAGLIASGATTPVSLSQNRRRFKYLQQHALLSIPYLLHTEHRAAEIFYYLHRQILRQFETRPVTLLDLWTRGHYNCITASYLYFIFARRYDLPVAVVETPMHAYIRLNTHPSLVIELTLPKRGFGFSQTRDDVLSNLLNAGLITPYDLSISGIDALFKAYRERQRILTPVQILAVFFYNRALAAYEHRDMPYAFQYALAAHLIHPEDARYRRLTRNFALAYATALRRDRETESLQAITAFLQDFAQ